MTYERLLIRTDGAARGNPGPASAGAVLIDASLPGASNPDAPPIAAIARPLGRQTNNVAEWTAVVLALERAVSLGAREVELVLDSKLVVEQLLGRWRVKEPSLKPFWSQARALLGQIGRWSARQEGRASNHQADAMANLALDDPAAAALVEAGDLGAVAGRRLRSVDPFAGASLRSSAPTLSDASSERLRDRRPADDAQSESSPALTRTVAAASSSGFGGRGSGAQAWICVTCGVQYPLSLEPPVECPVCLDERQYVGWGGQQWTSMAALAASGHANSITEAEPGLFELGTAPKVAIGQRALIVQTPAGNVMWDCISYVDAASVARLRELGGLAAIAISHPHFYGAMSTWSAAFGDCPVYVHAADGEWVQFRGPGLRLWDGDSVEVLPGVTLINTRGHFPGATVLHWAAGAGGKGALLTGDSITVVQDRRWVSFMYSYPNLVPVTDAEVRHIVEVLRPYRYDRLYSAWEGRVTATDGPGSIERSAERYLAHR